MDPATLRAIEAGLAARATQPDQRAATLLEHAVEMCDRSQLNTDLRFVTVLIALSESLFGCGDMGGSFARALRAQPLVRALDHSNADVILAHGSCEAHLALLYVRLGRYSDCFLCGESALGMLRRTSAFEETGQLLNLLAAICLSSERMDAALQYAVEAETLCLARFPHRLQALSLILKQKVSILMARWLYKEVVPLQDQI